MTYKEYLEHLLMESTLNDSDKEGVLELMESADSINELDAVGIILEEAQAKDMTLKEQQDASGASTANDDGKNINNEYDLSGYEAAEKKLEAGIQQISDGDIEKGCDSCGKAIADAMKIWYGVSKDIHDDGGIKKDVDELKDDVKKFKDDCKSGEVTASQAKTSANKLRVKTKLIAKKMRVALNKSGKKSKHTTESVLDTILEGSADGYLNDDDVELLVEAVTSQTDLASVIVEAKAAATDAEKKTVREKAFSTYYGALDKVSEKGARKLTPTADKVAAKENRIANNSDYDAYYNKYQKTKKKVKVGALTASVMGAAGVIPGVGAPMLAPVFAAGAKYSPNPDDVKMVDDAMASMKNMASRIKGKKPEDIDVNGAIVAGNSVKAAVKKGTAPDRKDIRIFDNVANKLNALMKKNAPKAAVESSTDLEDIRLLLEGCISDNDIDSAIETMSIVIESYDFMDDDLNALFDIAENTVDLRLV